MQPPTLIRMGWGSSVLGRLVRVHNPSRLLQQFDMQGFAIGGLREQTPQLRLRHQEMPP